MFQIFIVVLLAKLTQHGLSEECDKKMGVSSQAALKKFNAEITSILNDFTICVSDYNSSNDIEPSECCQVEDKLDALNENISDLQKKIDVLCKPGMALNQPANSCASVFESNPDAQSDYYWVENEDRVPRIVYCDVRSCGSITKGWIKVTSLDMTDGTTMCPSGLKLNTDYNLRTCGINSNSGVCSHVTFSVYKSYTEICGKIIAYQFGSPDAFGTHIRPLPNSINDNYVDGISLTHGSPRHHIWTFAAALDEDTSSFPQYNCPCTDTRTKNRATHPPTFVGNDYFCDTASKNHFQNNLLYSCDPLWDGAGCGPHNKCCSFNNPPWFYKQLSQPTTDDIEMRVCRDHVSTDEDIRIEMIDIYVH